MRLDAATVHPSRASPSATSRPIPVLAPVIHATFAIITTTLFGKTSPNTVYNICLGRHCTSPTVMKTERRQVSTPPLYPLRTFADLTGVNPVTLRAWERRYGLLKPARTAKGHRLYSVDDVKLVHRILELLDQGVPVSQVRAILEGPLTTTAHEARAAVSEDPWPLYRTEVLAALRRLDETALDSRYNEMLALYPYEMVVLRLILPLLDSLQREPNADPTELASSSFFRFFLRNKLGARLLHERIHGRGPGIVISALPEEPDDLLVRIVALFARAQGYQVTGLEPGLSLRHLCVVTKGLGSSAIVLAGSEPLELDAHSRQLQALGAPLPMPIVLYSAAFRPSGHGSFAEHNVFLTGPELQPMLEVLRSVGEARSNPTEHPLGPEKD